MSTADEQFPTLSFRKVESIEKKADSNLLHIESLAGRLAALEKRFGIENVVDASAAAAGQSAMGGETLNPPSEKSRVGDMKGHGTRHASFRIGGKEKTGSEGKKPFDGEAFKMPQMPTQPCMHRFMWFGPDRLQCDICNRKVSVEQARNYIGLLRERYHEQVVEADECLPVPSAAEFESVLNRAWDTNPVGAFDHPARGELIAHCAQIIVEHMRLRQIRAKGHPDANPTGDEGPISG